MNQMLKKDVKETRAKIVDNPVFTTVENGKTVIHSVRRFEFPDRNAAIQFVGENQDRLSVYFHRPRKGSPQYRPESEEIFMFAELRPPVTIEAVVTPAALPIAAPAA